MYVMLDMYVHYEFLVFIQVSFIEIYHCSLYEIFIIPRVHVCIWTRVWLWFWVSHSSSKDSELTIIRHNRASSMHNRATHLG